MTQAGKPVQISVTLETGTPDSVRQIRVLGWTGAAIMCSRSQYLDIRDRPDFDRPGVYVLVGPPDGKDHRPQVYIGQTNAAGERLDNHRGRQDFWTDLILFTTGDGSFNSSHFRHIEKDLYERATASGRAHLLNGNKPGGAYLNNADHSAADDFIERMLVVYPLLGVTAFQARSPDKSGTPKPPDKPAPGGDGRELWSLTSLGCEATAWIMDKVFWVGAGSKGRALAVTSLSDGDRARRETLIAEGSLKMDGEALLVTKDLAFRSASGAATILAGVSTNGKKAWKNVHGQTIEQTEHAAKGEGQTTP